ncbi:MAG TPA: heme-binding domain-containing protein [Verrucomicrobiae bacterium]
MLRIQRPWRLLLLTGAGLLALLQFAAPARTNPPVTRDFLVATAPPAVVGERLRAACYDCHSHETQWPWYSRVPPLSYLITGHVNAGRARLDLSAWPADSAAAARRLTAMAEALTTATMPLPAYLQWHPDARLTTVERATLATWLEHCASNLTAPIPPTWLTTTSPAAASNIPPPVVGTPPDAGRALFLKNCAHCHGADARGDEGPDLHHLAWSADQIAQRIRQGKSGQMTAFAGKLTAAQIQQLTAYVQALP